MEYGEVLTIKEQPEVYDTTLVCPLCKSSEFVNLVGVRLEDAEIELACECRKCKLGFDVYFSLHYVEHMVFPKSEQQ
jgi:transcription elongation factor Elf1